MTNPRGKEKRDKTDDNIEIREERERGERREERIENGNKEWTIEKYILYRYRRI